jgi:hypothetical protein
MIRFDLNNVSHVEIAKQAAEEAYLNVSGIADSVSEALRDENIFPTGDAISMALAHVRKWKNQTV